MKAIVLYHPSSEEARKLEEYAHDFAKRNNVEIEMVSLETRDGAATASLYDIVRYPAMLVVDVDGRLHKEWQGAESLPPLMNELAGYLAA